MLAAVVLAAGAADAVRGAEAATAPPRRACTRAAARRRGRRRGGRARARARGRTVHCPDWERGPGASLRCGLAALAGGSRRRRRARRRADLAPGAIERVVDGWRDTGAPLVAASYGGVRGHPVLVARERLGRRARRGLARRGPRLVPCDDLGAPGDVDTPARSAGAVRTTPLVRADRPPRSSVSFSISPAGIRSLARRLDEAAQRLLEPVPAPAVVAAVEWPSAVTTSAGVSSRSR